MRPTTPLILHSACARPCSPLLSMRKWFWRIFGRFRRHKPTTDAQAGTGRRETADGPRFQQTVQVPGGTFIDVAGDWKIYNGPVVEYKAQNMIMNGPPMTFDWPQLKAFVSPGAMYDSDERSPPPRCHPGTREAILKEIQVWYDAGATGEQILWLHGPAGAGKSAIAQTIAETWAKLGQLGATFFFSRSSQNRSAIKYLFPTLALQLALSIRQIRHRLTEILAEDPFIAERRSGAVDLIVRLFECQPGASHVSAPWVIVIDGLDECQSNEDQSLILQSIVDLCRRCRFPLRFLIVSRPEPHLKHTFRQDNLGFITKVLSLYGDEGAHEDVAKYLRSEFMRISHSERHHYTLSSEAKPWPSDNDIKKLVDKSGGYFIHAATVIRYIDEEYFRPAERLKRVLGISNQDHDSSPFAELDKLYLQVLTVCPRSQVPVLRKMLGFILFFDILSSVYHIESCLRLPPGEILLTLRGLHSLVKLDPDAKTSFHITSHHASFLDFLLDPSRSTRDYHLSRQEWFEEMFDAAISLQCNGVGIQVFRSNSRIPLDGDDPFVKFAPFQFAQMCLRLCSNHDPCVEMMRKALNLEPSDEDRLPPRDFWDTIEGLLRIIRVFNQRKELPFSQELTNRCESMLRSRLLRISDSPEKVRYVQAMMTLHSGFPRVASSTDCKEWPALLSCTRPVFGVFSEIDETLGIHHALESAETLDFLERFQLDSDCSGIFYDDEEIRNAYITTCLIRSFSSTGEMGANDNPDVLELLSQLLEYHIELAKAGDVEMMAQLRNVEMFPTQVMSSGLTTAVKLWLEKCPDTSRFTNLLGRLRFTI